MRQNILIRVILAAGCLFSLFCSRSDVITGAGESVVTRMDPALTDLGEFKRIDLSLRELDGLTHGFSLPEAADPTFGTTLLVTSERLPVGLNADGDTVAAHIQFRAQGFGEGAPYDSGDDLVGAYLYFRALDTTDAGQITVYRSDTLTVSTVSPVDRNGVDAAWCDNDEEQCAITLSGAGGIDSIKLTSSDAEKLFYARVQGDTISVAYSIIDYYGPLRVIGTPHLVLHVTKNENAVRDTLPRAARFTAFESNAEDRAEFAYSSFHTKRTAVFEIDVSKIIDSIKTFERSFGVNSELMNAVVSVRYEALAGNDGNTESESPANGDGYRPVTTNPVSYRMIALDTLLTKDTDIDTSAMILSREFGRSHVRTTEPAAVGTPNMFSIKSALQGAIDKGSGRIYVYLRPVAENGMMMWDKPQAIETVFKLSR